MTCSCGSPIGYRNKSGLCKPCNLARLNADADIVARKVAAAKVAQWRHVPVARRDDYKLLTRTKRIHAGEALRMVSA